MRAETLRLATRRRLERSAFGPKRCLGVASALYTQRTRRFPDRKDPALNSIATRRCDHITAAPELHALPCAYGEKSVPHGFGALAVRVQAPLFRCGQDSYGREERLQRALRLLRLLKNR